MLNKIILAGRLCRDPEIRTTTTGTRVASFTLAVDRDVKSGGDSVDYIDIVAWRNTADFVEKYFSKGLLINVVGRLQMRNWTDKNGNRRTTAEVIAESVYFAERKQDTEKILQDKAKTLEFEDIYDVDGELPF